MSTCSSQLPLSPPDECPVGCGRRRRRGHLMCGPCWSSVPKFLQRDVLNTWRRWRRNRADAGALRAYRSAVDAAMTSVAGPPARACSSTGHTVGDRP